MVRHTYCLLVFFHLFHLIKSNVETLHFESGCLKESNLIELNLHCSLYEHIEIIRVIYGYSKQRTIHQCQFSIYDCIQEGASRNILSCNGKQTCIINLTKNEILSTTVKTNNVPSCKDFNYVQVNFGCIPDAKDICDSWKDEGAIIHLSHTRSKDKQYNECQCKVRSSLSNGQVLLHAREINRQFSSSLKDLISKKSSNTDCKKTTFLEITTDRSERKCMDNLPSHGNALFGSGSHNFTLNYVRNDPFSELFFYFELKASPIKKDHHVQIICNWARRTTTIRTTLPMTRKRRLTTISMVRGGKLSRLDLIRHPSMSGNEIDNLETEDDTNDRTIDIEQMTTTETNNGLEEEEEEEGEEEDLTTDSLKKSTNKDKKTSTTTPIGSTTTTTISKDDDDEWSRILSMAGIESPSSSSTQLFSSNNRTIISSAQASILSSEQKPSNKMSKNKLSIIIIIIISTTIFLLSLYCLKVKQLRFIQRLKMNINIAFLFCCEAGKLLFSSSNNLHSISNTPADPMTNQHHISAFPTVDYQSSEYYMNDTGNICHTMQSIYDGGGKSIYSMDGDELEDGSEYMTNYDRPHDNDTC